MQNIYELLVKPHGAIGLAGRFLISAKSWDEAIGKARDIVRDKDLNPREIVIAAIGEVDA